VDAQSKKDSMPWDQANAPNIMNVKVKEYALNGDGAKVKVDVINNLNQNLLSKIQMDA